MAVALANLDAVNGMTPSPKELVAEKNQQNEINTERDPLSQPTSQATAKNSESSSPNTVPTPEEVAKTQNVANMSHSLAQTMTTTSEASVVLVIPTAEHPATGLSPVDPHRRADRCSASKGKNDFQLEPDDPIYIPKQPSTVTIIGGVVISGSTLYHPKIPWATISITSAGWRLMRM